MNHSIIRKLLRYLSGLIHFAMNGRLWPTICISQWRRRDHMPTVSHSAIAVNAVLLLALLPGAAFSEINLDDYKTKAVGDMTDEYNLLTYVQAQLQLRVNWIRQPMNQGERYFTAAYSGFGLFCQVSYCPKGRGPQRAGQSCYSSTGSARCATAALRTSAIAPPALIW
jgi:hypothetical protein